MYRLLIGIGLTWAVLFTFQNRPTAIETPTAVVSIAPRPTEPDPTTTSTTSTTTTIPVLVGPDTPCQEWVPEALAAGWPADRQVIETLLSVIYLESRCQPDAWNGHDAGLTQINQIHADWISELGFGDYPEAMFDPARNLAFAWRLYSSREAKGLCGWKPWSLSC